MEDLCAGTLASPETPIVDGDVLDRPNADRLDGLDRLPACLAKHAHGDGLASEVRGKGQLPVTGWDGRGD